MSRIGKKPIEILQGAVVSISGNTVTVEGPKGKTSIEAYDGVTVKVADNQVICTLDEGQLDASKHGLTRSLIANMVEGCAKGFQKELEIVGVGYRAAVNGQVLEMTLGHSHPIHYPIPMGVTITVDKQTKVTIEGIDKQLVGQVAADIRSFREPEPYKGKGVKYADERIIRKAGKAGSK
ncbi:MAG TPA: 50S ribosomal protein L6 [Oligoflexia bacterium]|nr:50S ribosomal protein L6 [Oligoflexia bacterium]HMR25758.1 50S ribosomal protein L6 [Oligoflexia bacterium]